MSALPIMCAAALHLVFSGEITSVSQMQSRLAQSFPMVLPNNGFILQPRPEVWEMGITLKNDKDTSAAGGVMWFKENGQPRWMRGKRIMVQIVACEDDGMLTALQSWGALAPAMR